MAIEEMFTELPTVSASTMNDIICAVQGYVSPTQLGLSTQQTLQQIYNLFQSTVVTFNAGNPNGAVAGSTFQLCWDTVDNLLWVCTTSGTSTTAVWTKSIQLTAGTGISITQSGNNITINSTSVLSLTGTANQVLVNGTSGTPISNTAITLTTPQNIGTTSTPIFAGFNDINGNAILRFSAMASAVNYISVVNSITGQGPGIVAAGSDTNIPIGLLSKGNASVYIEAAVPGGGSSVIFSTGTGFQHTSAFIFPDNSATRSYTWPDASGTIALTSGASGIVNPGLINQLGYYASSGSTISGLATAANGVLVTSAGSAPSISSTLPANLTIPTPIMGTILDSNSTNIFQFTAVASAVNYLQVKNAVTTQGPTIFAVGSDTNVPIGLQSKGNQAIFLQAAAVGSGVSIAFNTGTTFQHTSNFIFADTSATRNITWPDASGTVAFTSSLPTPAALTSSNDTNVTITLGGTPATALLQATSLTMGWTGQLGLTRGGTAASLAASNGGVVYSTASALAILSGIATANLPLLSGSSAAPTWGSFALSLGGALTTAGAHTLSGAFASTFTFTNTTSVTFPTSGTLATTSQLPTPAALTSSNDTNVTITLGGTPSTALLQATSLTMGWSGQLALTRGGSNASLTASNGGIVYSTASAMAILGGTATANQLLLSGASTTPAWSTTTYPATNAINTIMYASSANVLGVITPANSSVLVSSAGGVPSWSTTLPSGLAATNMSLTTPTLGVASATSINFGGTALANYLEGTFTPVLVSSGGGTATYSSQVGTYTRIGNRVFYGVFIQLSASALSAGSLTISGFPLAFQENISGTVWAASLNTTAITEVTCLLQSGASAASLWKYAAGTTSALTVSDITSGAQICISGHYHV